MSLGSVYGCPLTRVKGNKLWNSISCNEIECDLIFSIGVVHNILCGGRVDLVYEHCVLHIKYYAPIIEKRVTLSIKKEHTAVVTESVTMSESFIVTDYVTSSRVDLYFIDPL